MTQEQREKIETLLSEIERAQKSSVCHDFTDQYLEPLTRFARQQLNLRVDGEKLRERLREAGVLIRHDHQIENWKALVMECLTTEEKE
jgi:hypothetical protein